MNPPTNPGPHATRDEKKAYTKAYNAWVRKEDRAYSKGLPKEPLSEREKAKKEIRALRKQMKLEAQLERQAEREAMSEAHLNLLRKHDGERWASRVVDDAIV
jgi:hypothetical protein